MTFRPAVFVLAGSCRWTRRQIWISAAVRVSVPEERYRIVIARLPLEIRPQPNATTCGPTCLHAVYRYYGDKVTLSKVIAGVSTLPEGGTLGVFLGCHAQGRGYRATIQTYDLQVFDPTWFGNSRAHVRERLVAQARVKRDRKLRTATRGYLQFLDAGGSLLFEDLTSQVIRRHLLEGRPILTGLSATYLYRTSREFGENCRMDDIRGQPVGHFVVLCGYDKKSRRVLVADPQHPSPLTESGIYLIAMERVIGAIFLGAITYDANLLILEPGERRRRLRASADGRGT